MSTRGTVTVQFDGIYFDVDCTYSPSTPDQMYRANGDPGDPGDPEDMEVLDIRLQDHDVSILELFQSLDAKESERFDETVMEKCRESCIR